jgi:hypothetical protein
VDELTPAQNSLQADIQERDEAIARLLARIEDMAEERHMLHGAIPSNFWGCTRQPCQAAARFLREQPKHFSCRARRAGSAGGNLPQDCDWPGCGCDPAATRVLNALEESGRLKP